MAVVTLDELIERARTESGLRNNAYYDSDQIIRYLNAGGSELYDLFTTANQKYVIDEYDFTTTGQSDAVVSLPDAFQQGHSLEIYPDNPGQTRTIRFLSNWLNRNGAGNNAFSLAPGGMDPVYTFLGRELRFYPPQCTPAAPFRLYYTPMWVPLAAGIDTDFDIDPADNPVNFGGYMEWALANLNATSEMVGGALTLAFDAPNGAFSGVYTISQVLSPTAVVTTAPTVGGFTNPAAGTGNITAQPAGTQGSLPSYMAPWSEYVVVYAAMAINIDRQRPIGELERKLNALKARITSVVSIRQEEPQQPPLSRGPWGDGWGGGWGY